ncbi:hypothetical protein LSH36_78g06036 [Paralvinella palmiformis]|uniref:Uncharacterized protein n=1 Tax=Paralvinella palmiformis TaxID=53620 RepID=A0AAD9K2G4_9ANNE|nr:hypothetical protein LSH36_78g06036 [Paralvinella palmiformis]
MSTKRRLYKPAQAKKTVPKESRRKPLAQGRLIIDQSLGSGNDSSVTSQEFVQNSTLFSDDASQSKSLTQTARRDLSSLLKVDTLIQSETDPRRITPHASVHKSPEVSRPSESLDLSDTGSDVLQSPRDVLVVDASQRSEVGETEVDVHLEYANSPAKVIRHSPRGMEKDPSLLSGDVSQACRITVDAIPRVSIINSPEIHGKSEHSQNDDISDGEPESADQKRLEDIVERDVTEHPTNQVNDTDDPPVKSLFHQITGDRDHDALDSSQSTIHLELPASLTQSKIRGTIVGSNTESKKGGSMRSSHCVTEYNKPQPKIKSAALVTSSFNTKKKASRTVPSRYMQSVKKGPMKATDRSAITKTTSVTVKKTCADTSKSSACKKKRNTSTSSFNTTPEVKYFGGKVSTPAADDSVFMPADGVNVSEIKYDISDQSHQRSRIRNSMMSTNSSGYRQADYSNIGSHCDSVDKQEQVYGLSLENRKLLEANHELDRRIIQAQHLTMLDGMLETQQTGLTPLTPNLVQVKKQYSELATALDTTRHYMPTNNILVPEDDEEALKYLVPALLESEELLGEINTLTRSGQMKVTSFADAIQELKKVVDSELLLIDR